MANSQATKSVTETDGKKLWVFLVFGLGFFAGFLVSLVVADKIKPTQQTTTPSQEVATVPPQQEAEPSESSAKRDEDVPSPESHSAAGLDHTEVVLTKAMRDRLLTVDFIQLLQDAEIKRYRFEGETKGIVLNKIRTGSIYEKVGFKDGDILEQINGIAFADINRRKAEAAEKLPGADRLELKIRRNDKHHYIKISITDPRP
jgi:hypothetical protein